MTHSAVAARSARAVFRSGAALLALALIVGTAGCADEPEQDAPAPPAPVKPQEPQEEPEQVVTPQPGLGPACPTDHCVSIAFAGDFLFHPGLWRPFAIPTTEEGHNFDFLPLLDGAKQYLDASDLAIYQQETPLAAPGGPYAGFPLFSTPPEVAVAAKAIGFDVATTASNHSVDMGTEGLVRTLDTLEAAGLEHTGTYREEGERDVPLIVEANGVRIAVITSTYGLNGNFSEFDWQVDFSGTDFDLDIERSIAKAKTARELGADIVIGVQHNGAEYWSQPTTEQTADAHALMDSGEFDFMYSNHTHSIQPFEMHNGKWIHYGTGNFVSESAPPANRVNNEFLLSRVQFAQHPDGSWEAVDLAWAAATNLQNQGYRWCSVASDAPQGVCQWPEFDADVRERTRATVESLGAAEHGLHEWLITEE
ncbi:CapA family protein [Leucobacter komagatae]|uniref:CapA family protein n=1 Tax=Leucobacter komagatae TaxID=55969 RepID=UPI000A061514|nr:CapA family protein [Leucobacter komagatae]